MARCYELRAEPDTRPVLWTTRTAEQVKETVCEVLSQDRVQQRLVKQMMEVCKVLRKDILQGPAEQILKFPEPRMTEQLVGVPKIVVELAVSSGEAGSFRPGANDTTSAAATAVAESVDEARPLVIAKHSASTAATAVDTTVAKSVDETPPGIAKYSASTAATAVAKSVGEDRPLGIANHSASTESVFSVSFGEAGSFGPGANDTVSVAAAVVAQSVEGARPRGVVKYKATTEAELAESSGEFPVEVGGARLPGVAKCSAATAATAVAPTVAKSVGVGEARPPGFAKYSATSVRIRRCGPVQSQVPESAQRGR